MNKKNLTVLLLLVFANIFSQKDFEKGLDAFEQGDYDAAISFYSIDIKNSPKSNSFFNRAKAYYELEEYILAIEDLTIAISEDSEDFEAWSLRAQAYYKIKEIKKAFYDANKALRVNPDYKGAYTIIALCYNEKENYTEAIENFNLALEYDESASLYYNRAFSFQALEEFDKAENDFTKALSLDEKSIYYWGRANLFYQKTDYKLSIEDYSSAIELDSLNSALYFNRGMSCYANYQNENAIKDFKNVLKIDEKEIESRWYLALCYYELENYEEALKYYIQVENSDPSYVNLTHLKKSELETKTKIAKTLWYFVSLIVLIILATYFLSKIFIKN